MHHRLPTKEAGMDNLFLASYSLWRRELVRFYRDKGRVIGGLVPPVIFWFLISSGLNGSFSFGGKAGGMDYRQYFFPGTLTLIFLFTAVFSTISVIEDRKEGFLQSVLVAPIPRIAVVAGKLFGSATLAFLQGLPFLLAAPLIGLNLHAGSFFASLFILFGVAFSLAGLGFIIAWQLESTQGFMGIMNMGLIPMWFMSGALFPLNNLPLWLAVIAKINPLTYGVTALQWELFPAGAVAGSPSLPVCAAAIAFSCALAVAVAVWITGRGRNRHL
jgi:ABC-2 type transport system permease protein